jgi:hypothetical protein
MNTRPTLTPAEIVAWRQYRDAVEHLHSLQPRYEAAERAVAHAASNLGRVTDAGSSLDIWTHVKVMEAIDEGTRCSLADLIDAYTES